MNELDEKDLVISALRSRIGEIVSKYETEIAFIRAKYTKLEAEFQHACKILAENNVNAEEEQVSKKKYINSVVKK